MTAGKFCQYINLLRGKKKQKILEKWIKGMNKKLTKKNMKEQVTY